MMNPELITSRSTEIDAMDFLNQINLMYPGAISFTTGQPDHTFFNSSSALNEYKYYLGSLGLNETSLDSLFLYGKSKGIINDVIQKYLETDFNIRTNADNILLTNGVQESLSILCFALNKGENDCVLIEEPGYVGLLSLAQRGFVNLVGISTGSEGIDIDDLTFNLKELNGRGKSVRFLYLNPDFQNPLGSVLSLEKRLHLLELAVKYNFLIVEDSVYRNYRYSGDEVDTIKSLDKNGRVIFLNSFSKDLFPALRVGIMVTNDQSDEYENQSFPDTNRLVKYKNVFSINTSPINQLIVGGRLIRNGYSLKKYVQPQVSSASKKLELLMVCLEKSLGKYRHAGVSWNHIDGGFFIIVNLPFKVGYDEVHYMAESYNVIVCPTSFFYINHIDNNQIRLSFVSVKDKEIKQGVNNLSRYISHKLDN